MKKNLLFVIPSLSAGGGEKSLVNLLSQIDYSLYNVDVFLFNHQGIFMKYLPKEVNIIPLPKSYEIFTLPLHHSIKRFIVGRNLSLLYSRIMYSISNRSLKNISEKEQYSWKYLSKSFEYLNKKYDAAIGFLEKTSTYYCVDKVNAKKKIGWVHIDYDKLGMDPDFDIHYFKKLNSIITVSEECSVVLKKKFPSEKNKIKILYNIVSPSMINKMANQEKSQVYKKSPNEIVILSIGRLHYQKGFELAIKACKQLVDKGYNIKWTVIGEGDQRKKLENLINDNNLGENFQLLGLKGNPYPYIKQADIYAQTSRFEGKSIAIDEAKILQKPILVTNYSTAKDQISDGINGVIVDINSDAIVNGIEKLILDINFKKRLVTSLASEELGTENEITKLYELI